MEKSEKTIYTLIIGMLTCLLVLSIFVIYKAYKTNEKNKAEHLYNEIHDLYLFGGKLDYDFDKEIDESIKIKNYEVVTNLVSNKVIETVNKELNIKKVKDSYYMKRVGKGLFNYEGTKLEEVKKSFHRIEYKAISTFCDEDSKVEELSECTEFYTIEHPFIIVKEKGKWKVLEYTSILK